LREVLVLGAPRPSLQQLTLLLQREGYVPSVAHSGAEALQRIVREPIPPVLLVHWGTPGEGTQHFLELLQHAGALGWFSLLLIGGGELPAGLYAQERLASDCSTARLLEVLHTYTA
jgi:CheY-like chemotaxis protein